MRSFGILYELAIFFLLIKYSLETECHENEIHEKFCEDFDEDGRCKYEEKNIMLVECKDITNISKFKDATDFKYLSLYNIEISTLSGCDFEGLSHLIYLNLSYNNLRILVGGVFDNLPRLKILDLSHNNVKFVEDDSLAKVDNLEELRLNHNNISELPKFLGNCKKLKILDISDNKIVNLSILESCNDLVYLQISNNNIDNVDIFAHLPKLMFLDISNNRLASINTQIELPNLRFLNLSQNMLFNKKEDYLPPPLQELLNQPYGLDAIKDNQKLPLSIRLFRNMSLLNTLILSNTGIENLELGTFSDFGKLAILDLSNNNLIELPDGIFYELRSLSKLYLNDNQLQTYKYDSNPLLKEIDLNGNRWICGDLLELLRSLGNVNIVRRMPLEDRFKTNIYGITCQGGTLSKLERSFENLQANNEEALKKLDKIEEFFKTIQNDIENLKQTSRYYG